MVGDDVRRSAGVGRDLHRQPPTGPERSDPPLEDGRMIGDPLEAGCSDDEVVVGHRRPRGDVGQLGNDAGASMLDGGVEHCGRVVETDHLLDAESLSGEGGQFTRPASEVDGSSDRSATRSDGIDHVQ